MPTNLENPEVSTGLEKGSFHYNPKEGQCQRMVKLPYSHAHFACQQGYAQNPPSQASSRTENFQMYKLGFEEAEEPEIKLPTFTAS